LAQGLLAFGAGRHGRRVPAADFNGACPAARAAGKV
jgi:hypothetical protein